jgi:site-specific recombinase XerD
MAYAGWNALALGMLDQCQVETGILKDSVRVFFRWLKKRKLIESDLTEAIPAQTSKLRLPKVSKTTLSELAQKWYSGDSLLHERIAESS